MKRRGLFGVAVVACLGFVAPPAGSVENDGSEEVGSDDDEWDLIITGIAATDRLAESVRPAAVAAELGVTHGDLARALRAFQIAIYELRDGRYEGPPVTDEEAAAARRLADLVAIWADTGVASAEIQPLAAEALAPWTSLPPTEATESAEEAELREWVPVGLVAAFELAQSGDPAAAASEQERGPMELERGMSALHTFMCDLHQQGAPGEVLKLTQAELAASFELARLIARWSTGAAAAPEIQSLAAKVVAPWGSSFAISFE
ncbi:hypothetical protein WMF28_28705 [Sorangium sp. So ce590]|uniref:hypothetical protein n=1 Tax=Sorangium sp. So ce590 TaxID=3133317 RepID=UPI003F634507